MFSIALSHFTYPKPLPNRSRTSPEFFEPQTEYLEPITEPLETQNEPLLNSSSLYWNVFSIALRHFAYPKPLPNLFETSAEPLPNLPQTSPEKLGSAWLSLISQMSLAWWFGFQLEFWMEFIACFRQIFVQILLKFFFILQIFCRSQAMASLFWTHIRYIYQSKYSLYLN